KGFLEEDDAAAHQFDLLGRGDEAELESVFPVETGSEAGLQAPPPESPSRGQDGGALLPYLGSEGEPIVENGFGGHPQGFGFRIDGPPSAERGRPTGPGATLAPGDVEDRGGDIERGSGGIRLRRLFLFLLR